MSSVLQYPGFLYAATVCELSNSDVTELNEGCLAYVELTNAYYRLADVPIPEVPDGTTVVSVPGGPATPGCFPLPVGPTTDTRRWILTNIADVVPSTANSLAWFINAVLGSDTNDGITPTTPLKTARELGRRWKEGAGYNTGVVEVKIQSEYLLSDDIIDVERPIAFGKPVVFYGQRGADPITGGTLTGGASLSRPLNRITSVADVTLDFTPYIGSFIEVMIGGLAYTAYLISLDGVDIHTALTTPLTHFMVDSDLTSAVLSTAATHPLTGGESYRILGAGCTIPNTIILKTDLTSQVLFYDVTISNAAVPVPYTQQNLDVGTIAFARSQIDPASPSPVLFVAEKEATVGFANASSTGLTILSEGSFVSAFAYADLRAASNVALVQLTSDSVVADAWSFITNTDQKMQMNNVCINNSTGTKIRVINGTLLVSDALYGLNNADFVVSLADYARGYYNCGGLDKLAQLTIQGIGAVPANMNFQNGPLNVKPMDTINLPFMAVATSLDSQAGFIQFRNAL